ncbi:MAG: ATP-binding protein [Anaerolineae bacterium]|nr:ATP-binding protein [Anaerolineae bacterium]
MANTSSTKQEARSKRQETSEICPLCQGLGYVRADVPVDHPDFGKLVPCTCRLTELGEQRLNALRTIGNLEYLAPMTFESFSLEERNMSAKQHRTLQVAYESAREFAQSPNDWLLLLGSYGSGKTHLAAAIANACIERGQAVLFITVPDLLDHLRATFSPSSPATYDDRFEEVRTAPVLILDDLGTESSTPWAQEKLFQILNYRYVARLPTVITTNHELEEIQTRLRSRLLDNNTVSKVKILAPDYRRGYVDRDQSDLSSLTLHAEQTFETFELRRGEKLDREKRENLKHAFDTAYDFAKNPRGWLVFTGTYGCGKTHLAAAIANYNINQGRPALFIVVPDLLDHLRATFNPQSTVTFDQRFEEVRRAPLLVLDDLGTESATPWVQEKLHQVFDYRYNTSLPTVITTAVNVNKWDPRLRSRALDTRRCNIFEILAPAYRGTSAR